MNDQEIIDNAPSGAVDFVIIDGEYSYGMGDGFYGEAILCESLVGVSFCCRTIADIKRIVELEDKNAKMLECLCDISNACIAQMAMSYNLDAEDIGQSIYAATGMTNPQMNAALKEPKP
tara:strand:- start:374 stop:730 length:357 start_codon:yes stop_codon:yes gene_type:complete